MTSALTRQEGGNHYLKHAIQPIEYIHANGIPFAEGCAIKYLSRWRDKGGISDLRKAKHFIELLIEMETVGLAKLQPHLDLEVTGVIGTAAIITSPGALEMDTEERE